MVYSACFVGVVYVTRPVAVGPVICSAVVGYVVVSAASSEALHTLAYSINQSINQSINESIYYQLCTVRLRNVN